MTPPSPANCLESQFETNHDRCKCSRTAEVNCRPGHSQFKRVGGHRYRRDNPLVLSFFLNVSLAPTNKIVQVTIVFISALFLNTGICMDYTDG